MILAKSPTDRRSFLQSLAVAGAGLALAGPAANGLPFPLGEGQAEGSGRKLKLGMDNFAVRAMNWKAPALLDYASSLKLDNLLISDLDAFDSLEPASLREVKAKADQLGITIQVGTWSICPTSKTFKSKWGTAEEHLALGIRTAQALGSNVIRCVLGSGDDRKTDGGIEARMADTVKVCQACRTRAQDAGVKIAIENHAGDMQAWELVQLIQAAGKEYVGAMVDSGNAAWTLEDPLASFETLAPYAICTSLRDAMIWNYPEGAKVQWTAMGEGLVDWKTYFDRFAAACPGVPVNIETISGFSRDFPWRKAEFWSVWPKARAAEFSRFLVMAERGKALEAHRSPDAKAEQEYQKGELERSIRFCKEKLGLGLKGAS